ncbi:hypothetical protein L1887_18320 [Cichorium endivia]|nr:hypothetical protein L1887_18320 [Cichorium endivia]
MLTMVMARLKMAIDDLLIKLAKTITKPKLQTMFLINNYDMTIAVLKEAAPEGGKIQLHFEELLKNNTPVYVNYVGTFCRGPEFRVGKIDHGCRSGTADFASIWKSTIELCMVTSSLHSGSYVYIIWIKSQIAHAMGEELLQYG